jgi:hypothetical protein
VDSRLHLDQVQRLVAIQGPRRNPIVLVFSAKGLAKSGFLVNSLKLNTNCALGDTTMFKKINLAAFVAASATLAAQAKADDKFDLAIEAIIASDGMDTGLTYTDHNPNYAITFTPSYGIYYATLFAENVDYGPDSTTDGIVKLSAGATPVFGNLSVDFNLQRRWKPGEADHASTRWLPFVTATYTFNDQLNFS